MTDIPYGSAGIAAFEESAEFSQTELFAGSTPLPVTESFPVGESTTLAAFTVVGLDGSGNLVEAVEASEASPVTPIGITTAAVATGVGESDSIAVFRAGCFNPAKLTWPATFDTDAEQDAAFRGSPTPTNIILKRTTF